MAIIFILQTCFSLNDKEKSELLCKTVLTAEKSRSELAAFVKMFPARFTILISIVFLLHILTWYYITIFSGIYQLTSIALIYGFILSLIIYLVISFAITPLYQILLRKTMRECPKTICVFRYFY